MYDSRKTTKYPHSQTGSALAGLPDVSSSIRECVSHVLMNKEKWLTDAEGCIVILRTTNADGRGERRRQDCDWPPQHLIHFVIDSRR